MDYETIELLDENESTGEALYAVKVLTGDVVSVIVAEDGTEFFNDDWQSTQPKTFEDVASGGWRWYTGDEIDF